MSISPWDFKPEVDFQVWLSDEIDLSAGASETPVYSTANLSKIWSNSVGTTRILVKELLIMYTEATPGVTDATYDNIIQIGTDTSDVAVTLFTIPPSKSIGDVDIFDQADFTANARIFATNWIQIKSAGGASGAGKVRIGLTLSQDYTQWFDFDPAAG